MPSGLTMRERSGSTASVGRPSREGLRGPSPTPGYMRGAPSPAPTHAPPPAPSSARGAPSPAPSYARGAPSPAPGSVRGAPSPAPNYSRPTGSASGVSSPRLGAISRLPPLLSMPAPTRSSTLPTPSVSTHSPGKFLFPQSVLVLTFRPWSLRNHPPSPPPHLFFAVAERLATGRTAAPPGAGVAV
ncbi:hypothetical protein BV22DRAFT_139050 [Leucogyrophana mollusca]|uniref:Uncharacterized protein n=1 Tax=Leucogyrophana mollusca TaxID=85980 RepID=A0ACB8BVT7_9AGAM|nr:hypothetical protein BV22DRAFT_139050 [Leucogyrophana mollusca]